jgi:uncharacterized membrane protein
VAVAGAAWVLVQIQNIIDCYELYIICIITCIVLIYIHNLLLKYFANLVTWLTFLFVSAGIGLLGWLIRLYAINFYESNQVSYFFLMICAYLVWSLIILMILVILLVWKNIKQSVQVLRTAAKVIH